LPYGNCATVLLPGEIADGVLIIPEVRTAVKENLLEIFRDSLGPRSTAIDYRRCGPAGPAIMAPSATATNTNLVRDVRQRAFGGAYVAYQLLKFRLDCFAELRAGLVGGE
jgi:hypothetical protein